MAQEKKMSIGIGFGGGGATNSNTDGDSDIGGSANFYLDFLYNINYNISAGIKSSSSAVWVMHDNYSSGELTDMINYFAKVKYAFGSDRKRQKARLFIAADIGTYGIRPSILVSGSDVDLTLSADRQFVFGFSPEVGVQFRVFQMSLAYHFPGEYNSTISGDEYTLGYNMWMFNLGWNIGIVPN